MRAWTILLVLLIAPSASACSFFVNPDGGLDARVHSIRSGQFNFAGDIDYVVRMGEPDANGQEVVYSWALPFEGGATPEPFIHTYDSAGSYEVTLECHYRDDGTMDTYSEFVTVGAFDGFIFGVYWWIWLSVIVGVSAVVLAARSKQRKGEQ